MNMPSLLLTLQIALLCLTTSVLARPQRANRQQQQRGGSGSGSKGVNNNNDNDDNNNGGGRRSRPSGRRLRMLQKLFKKLTPDDMMQLVRAKKGNDYGDGGYGYGYGGSRYGPVTGGGQYGSSMGGRNISPHTTLINKVECPVSDTDMHMFACPSPDAYGRYECIDVRALCNDVIDCPNAEDENRTVCMFHKMHMNYFKVFTDAIFALTPSGAHSK